MILFPGIDPRIIFWNARHCVLGTLIIVSISMYHTKFIQCLLLHIQELLFCKEKLFLALFSIELNIYTLMCFGCANNAFLTIIWLICRLIIFQALIYIFIPQVLHWYLLFPFHLKKCFTRKLLGILMSRIPFSQCGHFLKTLKRFISGEAIWFLIYNYVLFFAQYLLICRQFLKSNQIQSGNIFQMLFSNSRNRCYKLLLQIRIIIKGSAIYQKYALLYQSKDFFGIKYDGKSTF